MRPAPATAIPAEKATAPLAKKRPDWWVWAEYLAVIVVAELVVSRSPQMGLWIHLALLLALLVHSGVAGSSERPLLLALALAPIIRIVSLALPLAGLPVLYWYLFTSLPVLLAASTVARHIGLSWADLGLRAGNIPLQVGISVLGLPLGLAGYLLLKPPAQIAELSWSSALAPSLILLLCTGFSEEYLFRGVLQLPARALLGNWGLVYISMLYAALQISNGSIPNLAFSLIVSLGFAWLARYSNSLLGIATAHGLANILIFLVLPVMAPQFPLG